MVVLGTTYACRTTDPASEVKAVNSTPIKSVVCNSESTLISLRVTRTNELDSAKKVLSFRFEDAHGANQSGIFRNEQQQPDESYVLASERPPTTLKLSKVGSIPNSNENYVGIATGAFNDVNGSSISKVSLACKVVLGLVD